MQKKNIVAIVPARANSKRIPGKNIKKFNGKPIIINTIEKLKKSKIFDRIIVSTDSKKIAKIAANCGAEIPFKRSKVLSNDTTHATAVISDCVKFLVKENYKFDYVCCVYAPNPFLQIADLKKGFYKIKSKKYNYVFSATLYQFPYFRSFTYLPKKGVKMLFKHNIKKRSQDIKKILCDAGQFYWGLKESWIKKKNFFTKNSDVVVIPKWRYNDLDTPEDWKRAELFNKAKTYR